MMMDIKNYYLGTPLPTYEHMRLPISILPLNIIETYDLTLLSVNGWVYLEIRKGMYGLKQAGILANQLLQKRLKPFDYYLARHTPCLWLHNTKPTAFSLLVDNFAVKYITKSDAHHLRNALLRHYEITMDWDGTVYSGIALDWDYNKRTCHISMPGYLFNVLNKFQHDTPKTPQHTPSRCTTIQKSLAQFYITHVQLIQRCLCPQYNSNRTDKSDRENKNCGRPTLGISGHAPCRQNPFPCIRYDFTYP
jgi:hypothetical protein